MDSCVVSYRRAVRMDFLDSAADQLLHNWSRYRLTAKCMFEAVKIRRSKSPYGTACAFSEATCQPCMAPKTGTYTGALCLIEQEEDVFPTTSSMDMFLLITSNAVVCISFPKRESASLLSHLASKLDFRSTVLCSFSIYNSACIESHTVLK
jgi:hypothetical protein